MADMPSQQHPQLHSQPRRRKPILARWQRVRLQEYRELGNAIKFVEALAAGEPVTVSDDAIPHIAAGEKLLTGEQLACKRGACKRVLEATVRSLAAVSEWHPAEGQDLVIAEVRVSGRE